MVDHSAFWAAAAPVMSRSMSEGIEAGLAAIEPVIRADERKRIEKFAIPAWREEIAQEIEALLDGTDMSRFGYPQGVTDAAHIARQGGSA